MQRLFLAVCLIAGLATAASAGMVRPAVFSKQDVADLDRLSTALNTIQTMTGEFDQTNPNGTVSHGTFSISKPGKMRFDYLPPASTLVWSNGLTLYVYNSKLKTQDGYPLSTTPLNILLSNHVNLKKNSAVIGLERQANGLVLNARSNDRRVTGNITVLFSEPNLELRQWTIVDAQGQMTTVSLRNVQTGVAIPDEIFGKKSEPSSDKEN